MRMLEKDYQLTGKTVELQQAKKTVGLLQWQLGTPPRHTSQHMCARRLVDTPHRSSCLVWFRERTRVRAPVLIRAGGGVSVAEAAKMSVEEAESSKQLREEEMLVRALPPLRLPASQPSEPFRNTSQ
jgi:hypothetical protein